MTRQQAEELVALLVAAFPYPQPPVATLALYAGELERLDDADLALAAIQTLYRDGAERLPTIAAINGVYRKALKRRNEERALRALEEPPFTDAERAENLKRVGQLLERLTAGLPLMDETSTLEKRSAA